MWFVMVRHLEDMRCVDPIVFPTAHDIVPIGVELIDWVLHLINIKAWQWECFRDISDDLV